MLPAAKLLIPKASLAEVKGLLMTGAPLILVGSLAGKEGGGRILAPGVVMAGGADTGGVEDTVKAGNPDPRGLKSSDSELSLVLSTALGSKSSSFKSSRVMWSSLLMGSSKFINLS